MNTDQPTVIVDTELAGLIPPATDEELAELEASLRREGCRDALVVWAGHGILLDGHQRLDICKRVGIPYRVAELDLEDRDDAKLWIIRNQLARRNLPLWQRLRLAEAVRAMEAAKAKKRMLAGKAADPAQEVGQAAEERHKRSTDQKVAELAGTSRETVRKAKVVREQADPETLDKVERGEMSISKAYGEVKQESEPQPTKKTEAARVDLSIDPEYYRALEDALNGLATAMEGLTRALGGKHLPRCFAERYGSILQSLRQLR